MMSVREFLTVRRAKKALRAMRNDFLLHEDVLPPETRAALAERFEDLRQAIRCRETEALDGVVATWRAELAEARPRTRWPVAAEWFDVIVSALAVAFCFRAYYYQPFQIPTGSMQPTLYGIHAEEADAPSAWDKGSLRFLKWCATGERYQEVRVRAPGIVSAYGPSEKPGYGTVLVNGRDRYDLPSDVALSLRQTLPPGSRVAMNQCLWRGYVRSGDFLFVNRWVWNFRHPRLGETIVFSTRGLPMLPDNQHYIKRLCGRPGDTVELRPDSSYLWVNGRPATEPARLEEIAEHLRPWPGAPAYPGYAPAQGSPYPTQTRFALGPGEYLALGDNSGNSLDSRYWGTVPSRNLLGPASFVHWPFASPRWGKIR